MNIIELVKKHKRRILWSLLMMPLGWSIGLLLMFPDIQQVLPIQMFPVMIVLISCVGGIIIDKISSFFEKGSMKFYVVIAIILIILGIGTVNAAIEIIFVSDDAMMVEEKPALYLYPESDSMISVKLDVKGKIIKDIPPYNDGWYVFATKDSLIDGQYDYLFYETMQKKKAKLDDRGWVVEKSELEEWFDLYLPELGLNEKETLQFEEYWLERLSEECYYEIKLVEDKYLEENVKLIIEPKPDTVIRLIFHFKAVDERTILKEPVIETPVRKGFTVVEWGGIVG